MQAFFKTHRIAKHGIATLLAVAFAALIAGPLGLLAQEPITSIEEMEALNNTRTVQDSPGNWPDVGQAANPQARSEASQGGAPENNVKQAASIDSCGLIPYIQAGTLDGCLAYAADKAMWLSARTLWIAGVLFNISINYTLNLHVLLEKLPVVDIGWKVLRDLSNIVFIFITLWAGINITLGIDGGKKAWGYLAQMVLVALFINFSLFIAKAVVDFSNVAALHFYSLMVQPGNEADYDSGLSEAFLYGLKLGTLYNTEDIKTGTIGDKDSFLGSVANTGKADLSGLNIILIGFFGSVFIITTAWVFFAAALMFIFRAITLIFLMMTSPLAFIGLILPGTSGMAHEWWKKLWSQSLFAPIYLALAYVVIRAINAPAFQSGLLDSVAGSGNGFAGAITGTGAGTVAVVFNFVIIIGLMVACLMVAQSLGAKGSDMAMAGWDKIKGGAIGVAGAATRGIIKAPSAAMRGAGGLATGAPSKAIGNWMATSRLLNNRAMRRLGVSDWAKNKGEGMVKNVDTKMEESKFRQFLGKAATKTGNILDVRHLEERASESVLGNTFVGKAVRSVTTGAIANMPIGGKSLQEAYVETQHDKTARNTITWLNQARAAGSELKGLRGKQNEHQEERFEAEKKKKKAEDELELARQGLTPEQIQEIAEAKGELAEAKKVPEHQEEQIAEAQKKLAKATESLADAEKKLAQDPTNVTFKAAVDTKTAEVDEAKKEVTKQTTLSPEQQQRIKEAEDKLAKAKTRHYTQQQQTDIAAADARLTQAKKESVSQIEQDIANINTKLAQALERLEVNPGDAAAAKDAAQYKLELEGDATHEGKVKELDRKKKENEANIKKAEGELETAKKPALTPEQQQVVTDKDAGLKKAVDALTKAEEELEEFNKKQGALMHELTKKKQEAYAQISSHEYITFATKEDLINLPDFEDMPLGHYIAATEDEERLTEAEKERMTHNYLHRLIEISKRGEIRNEWFHENIIKHQRFLNKQAAYIKLIAPELQKDIERVRKELEAKIEEEAERKRKIKEAKNT